MLEFGSMSHAVVDQATYTPCLAEACTESGKFMKKAYFVTGTDTEVGKTWATLALMRHFQNQQMTVAGMKPVAAGCEMLDGELKNEDALLIQQHSSVRLAYQDLNPYAFELPVSPHLACARQKLDLSHILECFSKIQQQAEVVIVEGAGGWLAPLSEQYDIADLAKAMDIPVVLVVAIKLGCINHARLSFEAIQSAAVPCVGWLAMCVDPEMQMQKENIQTLEKKIKAPLLGVLPYQDEMRVDDLEKNIIREKLI